MRVKIEMTALRTFTAMKGIGAILLFSFITSSSWADHKTDPVDLDVTAYTRTDSNGLRVIHIPGGTYKVSRAIALPSNSILEGEGDATVLTVGPSFSGSRVITNADFARGNSNIVIRNLRVEFTATKLYGSDPGILRFRKVEQLEIHNIAMMIERAVYGIDLSAQVRNAVVEGCTITNTNTTAGGGVMIRNGDRLPARATSDIVVRNNSFESASDEPVAVFGWEGAVENIRIENNTIRARGASFGITAFGANDRRQRGTLHNVSIVGNAISGSRVGGIGIHGGARSVEVAGNSVQDAQGDGIFLHSGGKGLPDVRDVRIHENKIKNSGRHGIFASGQGIRLEGNEIENSTQCGIYAAGDVSVVNNDITGANPGVLVDGKQLAEIKGNRLRNAGSIRILNGTYTDSPKEVVR